MELKIGDPVLVIYDRQIRKGVNFVKKLHPNGKVRRLTNRIWEYNPLSNRAMAGKNIMSEYIPAPNLAKLLYGVG
jgi:hypothetical protein